MKKEESAKLKVAVQSEEDNRLKFQLEGVPAQFANMVRRYMMNRVAAFAIEEVTFYDNTSNFFDEYLAHRIGLIPLTTPEGAPETSEIVLYLDATGPKIVYSSELESKDKDVKVARDRIPIVTLSENQALRLEAKAKLATAQKHAKFQPGLAAYEIAGDKFNFFVESFYQMGPKELVLRAVSAAEKDVSELGKQLEKLAKKKK